MQTEIKFNKSMGLNKRDTQNFAYLRYNLLTTPQGAYPQASFETKNYSGYEIKGVYLNNADDLLVLATKDGQTYEDFYTDSTPDGLIRSDSDEVLSWAKGEDGRKVFGFSDGRIYKFGDIQVADLGEAVVNIIYDGVLFYYFLDNGEIWKHTGDEEDEPVKAFEGVPWNAWYNVAIYNDEIIMVEPNYVNPIIYFWDKNDNTLFRKRIDLFNIKFLGFGILDGKLLLTGFVGNSLNPKESKGEIQVLQYNGENFEKVNAINVKTDDLDANGNSYKNYSSGHGIMLIALDGGEYEDDINKTLNRQWILKIHSDYSMEYVATGNDIGIDGLSKVYPFVAFDFYALFKYNDDKIFVNYDNDPDYDDYYTGDAKYYWANYITNFYGDTYKRHKLKSLTVAFEKLYEQNNEKLWVYYRLSDREQDRVEDDQTVFDNDWQLLGYIDTEIIKNYSTPTRDKNISNQEQQNDKIGLGIQTWTFTHIKNENGNVKPLPEYNEIQFSFVIENGFSIIKAKFEYDYTTRNAGN